MKTITLCPGDNYRGYWIEGDPGASDGDAFIRVYRSREEAEEEDTKELGAVVMLDGNNEKNHNDAYAAFVVSAEDLTEKNPRECGTAPTYMMALNLLIDELKDAEASRLKETLRKLVGVADSDPFCTIGHLIEHFVPEARDLIKV